MKSFFYLLIGVSTTGCIYCILKGVISQFDYFSNLVMPLFVIYYIGIFDKTPINVYTRIFKVFIILSFSITFIEFYFTNILNVPVFNFSAFWDDIGVEGYHASKGNYLFLGTLDRPWGILAMPQASGSLFSVLFIYFIFQIKSSKINIIYCILTLIGVYISASRTAMLAVIFSFFCLYYFLPYVLQKTKKIVLGRFFGFIVMIVLLPIMGSFIIFTDFTHAKTTFENSFFIHVLHYYISPTNVLRILFGTGSDPNYMSSEYGIINNIISIGLLNVTLLISFMVSIERRYNGALNSFALKATSLRYLLPTMTFLFGGMHYNLFRYPANMIFAVFIGFIIRNLLKCDQQYAPMDVK